ncbi:hypothetical protein D1AOALGA4SA_1392 [Olavius algarvensis Delta 1 endosymbiont]|nr:hypothetical protein D1AOALGA4SA_1392 [Olavius algarvensis Delta 1 endosymbiont]
MVLGFRCQEIWVFGIRYSVLDTQPPMKLHWNDECRMTNDE